MGYLRLYQNTFEDAARQDAIELLLNQHERLSQPYITRLADNAQVIVEPLLPELREVPLEEKGEREVEEQIPMPPLPAPLPPITLPSPAPPLSPVVTPAPHATTTTPKQSTGSLRVWFGTWNLGGRRVNEPLEKWLIPGDAELPSADFYVIAIQELVSREFKDIYNMTLHLNELMSLHNL